MALRNFLRRNRRKLIICLTPLLLLPLPLVVKTQEARCGYGLLLMAVLWMTEAIPISVTAMLPIILFPMMGVSRVKDLASKYISGTIFVFLGGMSVAVCIEKWNIHRRFALKLLLLLGTSTKWLTFGFMVTTAFMSMWVSNTATTSMMIPIGQAVLVELVRARKGKSIDQEEKDIGEQIVEKIDNLEENESKLKLIKSNEDSDTFEFEKLDTESKDLCKLVCLCICYSANCGGIGTLTGTGPNLVLKGQLDQLAGGSSGITFATWFIFGFPITVVSVLINWVVLQIMFFGWRGPFTKSKTSENPERIKMVLQKQYENLGEINFAQKAVCVHFVMLVLLWFSLEPEFVPGWGHFFKKGYVSDAVPGMIIATSLFIFPSRRRSKTDTGEDDTNEIPPLLDWQTFVQKIPWGVTLLLGGGFALAFACQESGLSLWLGAQLSVFRDVPVWIMIFIICLIVSLTTEVISNTATCTIVLPVLANMAAGIHLHPTYLMLPASVACSFAFMLPVATPPNTIAFSYGYLKVTDMMKVGVFLNFICVIIVTVAINTYGAAFFNLHEYPDWKLLSDQTMNINTTNTNSTLLQ
ncbi:Na(+)/citrate cotransporter-like [Mytilus edulis]|uniref:Na(+)/citrate cotransporter-like n=1 Tax=Mytilus edulis TaxID=6550 RepID=UPI0039EFF404